MEVDERGSRLSSEHEPSGRRAVAISYYVLHLLLYLQHRLGRAIEDRRILKMQDFVLHPVYISVICVL